jgi:hypothetical protein
VSAVFSLSGGGAEQFRSAQENQAQIWQQTLQSRLLLGRSQIFECQRRITSKGCQFCQRASHQPPVVISGKGPQRTLTLGRSPFVRKLNIGEPEHRAG